MKRLYHRTTKEAAAAILAEGFRDATDRYMTDRGWTGVWLSDRPLDGNEGAPGDALFAVDLDLPEGELESYEWVEEWRTFREFLVPAAIANAGAVRLLTEEEVAEAEGVWGGVAMTRPTNQPTTSAPIALDAFLAFYPHPRTGADADQAPISVRGTVAVEQGTDGALRLILDPEAAAALARRLGD